MIAFDDVKAAHALLENEVVATPCLHSRTLSSITGAQVWVKFENHQFTASFKERGAFNKLCHLSDAEKRRGVIAMSAGNHAQAVAYLAGRLGISAIIVMPAATPFTKIAHTRDFGARVVLHGDTLNEAEARAREIAAAEDRVFVHPYDDPHVMAGQGTIAIEMLDEVPGLDLLVVPIGGGGLIAGMAIAGKAIKPSIELVGVECAAYPSMDQALQGKSLIPGGSTIAEGIAVKTISPAAAEIVRAKVGDIILVDEPALERAIGLYLMVEKTVAEGAGAAALAALLTAPQRFAGRSVGLVLSGGNIDPRLLAQVINRELVREGRLIGLRVPIHDRPGALAEITQIIGEAGGNIIDVIHQRLFMDVPAKGAVVDFLIETRDAAHVEEIVAELRGARFTPRILTPIGGQNTGV